MDSVEANIVKTLQFLSEHYTTIVVSTSVFLLLSSINAGIDGSYPWDLSLTCN